MKTVLHSGTPAATKGISDSAKLFIIFSKFSVPRRLFVNLPLQSQLPGKVFSEGERSLTRAHIIKFLHGISCGRSRNIGKHVFTHSNVLVIMCAHQWRWENLGADWLSRHKHCHSVQLLEKCKTQWWKSGISVQSDIWLINGLETFTLAQSHWELGESVRNESEHTVSRRMQGYESHGILTHTHNTHTRFSSQCVSQWARECSGPVSWISVGDNEAFFSWLIQQARKQVNSQRNFEAGKCQTATEAGKQEQRQNL